MPDGMCCRRPNGSTCCDEKLRVDAIPAYNLSRTACTRYFKFGESIECGSRGWCKEGSLRCNRNTVCQDVVPYPEYNKTQVLQTVAIEDVYFERCGLGSKYEQTTWTWDVCNCPTGYLSIGTCGYTNYCVKCEDPSHKVIFGYQLVGKAACVPQQCLG
jgi:hypothetical protein